MDIPSPKKINPLPQPVTEENKEAEKIRLKICEQLNKMFYFKNTYEFAFFIFSYAGRFAEWRNDCIRISCEIVNNGTIPPEYSNAVLSMIPFAEKYAQNRGEETLGMKLLMNKICNTIRYDEYEPKCLFKKRLIEPISKRLAFSC